MKRITPALFLSLGCVLGLLAMPAGCESSGNSGDDDDMPGSSNQASLRDPVNLRAGIPPSANEVAQGTGSLTYTATESGQVYLYDLRDNRVVGTYTMRPGQTLTVASNGRGTIDGNEVVVAGKMSAARRYLVYLLPLPNAAGSNDQTYRITPTPPAGGR